MRGGSTPPWREIPRALEFLLLRYRPEPWEPLHTLALGRVLAWELSQWHPRLVLAKILPRLDPRRREDLVPIYPADGPLIVAAAPGVPSALGLLGPSGGSNGWVVGPERSASGAPLLANDPHLPLGAPSRWYEVHLVGASLDVYGFSIPGAAGVIIGANAELAWGFTNLMLDDLDLYRERLHPEREDLYEVAGRWEPLTRLAERIEVKGGKPGTLEVRIGRHGPLITPTLIQAGEPLALRWTGQEPGQEVAAILGMNRARTWPEFREALRRFATPAQNVVYADRSGTIAYQAVGRIPVRPRGGTLLPLEGWHGRDDWRGWVPFERLPSVVNPPAGVVVTANNRVSDPGLYISHLWEPPDRALRIRELLDARPALTLDDLRAIQLDRRPPWVRRLVPLILEAWKDAEGSGKVAGGLDLLKAWAGALEPASPAAALFEATVEELLAQTFRDELGEDDYREFGRAWDLAGVVLDRLLERGTSPWFDDVTTPEREDLPELLRRSLRAALRTLQARLGPDPAGWRWERLHTVALEHPLGRRRPLGLLFSLGPYGMGGDGRAVWKSHFYHDGRFRAVVGPSFRMLVDLGDRRRSRVVITTGQSGHPFSRHYRDQTPLWLAGEDRPMLVEREAIEREAEGRLHLLPAK